MASKALASRICVHRLLSEIHEMEVPPSDCVKWKHDMEQNPSILR